MSDQFYHRMRSQLDEIKEQGLYKTEKPLLCAQQTSVRLYKDNDQSNEVINLCANNYLGLANHPELIKAAKKGLDDYGFGVASVRFICGTQDQHKLLEAHLAAFLGMEDTILYSSCFDANAGLFETILTQNDAVISDALNHASIIDGIRLCKAARFRYANNDMSALESALKKADQSGCQTKLIVTDGVFSMDGIIANLPGICDLAEKYSALVMVDDSHAVGFMGDNGAGTHRYHAVQDRVDILTGTLGKALGGASGGYTAGKKELIEWLRQRSRPYLFSNSLAPAIVNASLHMLKVLKDNHHLRAQLLHNADYFRKGLKQAGFDLIGADHAIVPVLLNDEKIALEFSQQLLEKGVYAVPFSYPVVPKNQARIRTQMSAAHSKTQLDKAIAAFIEVGKLMDLID